MASYFTRSVAVRMLISSTNFIARSILLRSISRSFIDDIEPLVSAMT
jgi:hypothetical protein